MNAIKRFYTAYIKRWVKALGSAVGGAIAGLLINWVQGTTPIPQTQKELYTLLIATVVPPILTLFAPANKITQKQLDDDPNVVGGLVVPDAPPPHEHVIQNPTTGEVGEIPRPPGRRDSWRRRS